MLQPAFDRLPAAPELLERDAELARIRAALESFTGVLVVEGEAGIGKSALLDAASDLARRAGARVLAARGGRLERDFGHGIARQLFERPVREARGPERSRWLAGAAGLAAPVLGLQAGPDVTDPTPVEDPAFAVQHGLYWLAANMASDRPLVLVVDDLQWADRASLRWLVYLARRADGLELVLLGGWRSGEPGVAQDLFDALEPERVTLRPLSIGATTSLINLRLGRECDGATAHACHVATAGNPLFVTELAHAMGEDDDAPADPQRAAALAGRAVAPYLRRRLATLAASAAEVARAAAVLESDILPRHLAEITQLAPADIGVACDQLVRARVLTGDHVLAFAHPLVRSAIYDSLDRFRRAAAHRAAADALEADGLADRAAIHLLASERTGDEEVLRRLTTAAQRALQRGAVEEAVILLRRAVEEPPPAGARHEVLMPLAHCAWLAGDDRAAADAREALSLAGSADDLEAAAILLARLLSPAGRQQEAVDVLADVADRVRDTDAPRAVRLEVERVAHTFMLIRPPPDVAGQIAALWTQVVPGSVSEQLLHATAASGASSTGQLPAAAIAQLSLNALADGRMVEDLSVTAAFGSALTALGNCERLDECLEYNERRREFAARSGSRLALGMSSATRGRIAWLRGDVAEAVKESRDALALIATPGFEFVVPYVATPLVHALVEQGDLDAAQAVLDRHDIAHGLQFAWIFLVPARIGLALARGDLGRARGELAVAPPERDRFALRMAPSEIAVALADGQADLAREHAVALLDVANRFGAPGELGIARRWLGLATGGEEGRRHLRSAAESLDHSQRRLELAAALVDLGASLRRGNQRAAARAPLRRGLDVATRCGATVLAQRAADELRATGARPRKVLLTGVESLTPSELRVARLVADGRSNHEAAQVLFVTRRTLETHLVAIFRKLDINRRQDLAAALRTDGPASGPAKHT